MAVKFPGLDELSIVTLVLNQSTFHMQLVSELVDRRLKNEIDDEQLRTEYKIVHDQAMVMTIVEAINMNSRYLLAYLKAFGIDTDQGPNPLQNPRLL
jgi:Na+-transporting methylmalonyl-CoA/oxaloacetate decarboxylase gamma subunit